MIAVIDKFFDGVEWLNDHLVQPFGEWVFTKRLVTIGVFGYPFAILPIQILLLAAFAAFLVASWFWTLIVLGATLGLIIVVAGLVVVGSILYEEYKSRVLSAAAKAANAPKPKPRPNKGPSIRSIFWSWIVAKKHRICPLIVSS